jgi:GT2 family glycosyltransferase
LNTEKDEKTKCIGDVACRHALPFVSVIIATYEREELLCNTLEAIVAQTYPCFEIIVVDQTPAHLPSTQQCLDLLRESGKLSLFFLDEPSLPAARNFGIRKAYGHIILFVDDDVDPSPDLILAHASQYTSPEIIGVAGRRTFPTGSNIVEEESPVGALETNADHISNFSSTQQFPDVNWASGCNMSFRKSALIEAGGFDTRFGHSAVYEDVDICYRLRDHGHRIVFSPDAHLVHLIAPHGGCRNRMRSPQYYYGYFHNSLLFALKNLRRRDLPTVLVSRFLMSLALARQNSDLQFPFVFMRAATGAFWSYFRQSAAYSEVDK